MNWAGRTRTIFKWTGIGMALVVACGAALFGLLQTGPGRQGVVWALSRAFSKGEKLQVEMGKAEGLIPFRFGIDRMAIRDERGLWLRLSDLVIDWSPVDLLKGRFHVRELRIGALHLERAPDAEKKDRKGFLPLAFRTLWLERLKVDHFAMDEFILGAPFLGEAVTFRTEASLMAALSEGEWLTSFHVERTDGPAARVSATARIRDRGPEVTLDVEALEAPGGPISRKLGMEGGPISISLRGSGPVQQWKGRFEAGLGDGNVFRGDLRTEYRDDLTLGVDGVLILDPALLPEPVGGWVGRETRFIMTGRLGERREIHLDRLFVESGDTRLELSGTANPKEGGLAGRFRLDCKDLTPLGPLLKTHGKGVLSAEGDLSGTFAEPRSDFTFRFDDLEVDRVALSRMSGAVGLAALRGQDGKNPVFHLRGKGDANDFSLRELGAFPERELRWELVAEGPFGGGIRVKDLSVTAKRMSLRISGEVDPSGPHSSIELETDVGDLRPFTEWVGMELGGATRLRSAVKGDLREASLSATLKGTLRLQDKERPFGVILGDDFAYEGSLNLREGRSLALSDARLSAKPGMVTGSGSVDLVSLRWQGAARIHLQALDRFSPLVGTGLGGVCRGELSLEGSSREMRLRMELQGEEIVIGKGHPGKASVSIEADGFPQRNKGYFRMSLGEVGQGVSGKGSFSFGENRLSFFEILLSGPGASRAEGDLAFDFRNALAEGRLKGGCESLSPLSSLLGESIEGRADFTLEVGEGEQEQQVRFSLQGARLKSAFGSADTLDVQGRIRDPMGIAKGNARAKVEGFRLDRVLLSSLRVEAEGDAQEGGIKASAKGSYDRSFEADLSGLFSRRGPVPSLTIKEFQGRYGTFPVRLADPFQVEWTPEGISYGPADLRIGGGHLSGSGRTGERREELTLHLRELPVGCFMPAGTTDVAGLATGEVLIKGPPGEPEAQALLRIEGIGVGHPRYEDLPRGRLEAKGVLRHGRLGADFSFGGFTPSPITGEVELPLLLSLSPFSAALPSRGGVKGNLTGSVDLARMGRFLALDDQSLGGNMKLGVSLEGTVEQPRFAGGAEIREGTYEHARTGTILRNVEAKVTATPSRLVMETATADDGEKGTIQGKGWMDLNPQKDFPFHVELWFQKAKLVRHDWATAAVGGQVDLKGSLSRAGLFGEIVIESAEMSIPDRLPPDMPDVEVIEINKPENEVEGVPPRKPTVGPPLDLGLGLKSPGHVQVTGRGLESEWRGDLRITGTSAEPVVTGDLSVIRGRFNFLDRRFNLKEGKISFSGMVPPSPAIDVLAEASARDITARLRLRGPLSAPAINLSSDPPLPSDEVLSRLLFGKSVSRVTPMQAVQLVQALNLLAGGRTLDLLGQTRRLLGVDQLEVKQSVEREQETSVSAGKYLGDNVYIEVEKELGPRGPKASLDWEITPHISIETEVGTDAEGGMGINWKWDY